MRGIIILCILSLMGCSSPVDPPKEVLSNIIELKKPDLDEKYNNIYGKVAIIRNGNIYSIPNLNRTTIDQNNTVLEYKNLKKKLNNDNWLYINGNEDGSKLLLVRSRFSDVCAGSLYEFNSQTEEYTKLLDSTNYISSAKYLNGDDTKLIFYKYGNLNNQGSGYYSLDLLTKKEELLYSYVSKPSLAEMVNAFDIHPSNKKLLICLTQGSRFEIKPPILGVYDITNKKLDTLNVSFDETNRRSSLWLKYNSKGTKILYSYFPRGAYSYTTNGTSEAGIIEINTLQKNILDLNTGRNNQEGSVQISVEWDKTEERIIFCSAPVSVEGALGTSKLYILKQIP